MTQNDYFKHLNNGLPEDIENAKNCGDLDKAIKLIDERLKGTEINEALKGSLLVQKEMINRLKDNFTVSFNQAFERIQKEIPDFKADELQKYLDERRVDWIYINKEVYLVDSYFGTFRNYVDFKKRLPGYKEEVLEETWVYNAVKEIKEKGYQEIEATIKHRVRVDDEYFKEGNNYLVHLPIPRIQDNQKMVKINSFYPEGAHIDNEKALQRTISWNKKMDKNDWFEVEYTYSNRVEYVDLTDKKGEASDDFLEYTKEEYPHIVFSPYIKELCAELTKGIDDPLEKAKKFYDYITLNMKYAYQRDYFCMDNIPLRCARNHRGDCGVFALLFITLCRCASIPAKWESCMCVDDGIGSHDWARFYVKPFGWLYCDPSYGVGQNRRGFEEGRQFYFGNLDAYRMVANHASNHDFEVNKKFFRADPVDSQLGEIEDETHGLKFEEFTINRKLVNIIKK